MSEVEDARKITSEQSVEADRLQAEDENLKNRTILRHWFVYPNKDGNTRLMGDVENHPVLGTARNIITSRVKYMNETVGVAATKNTVYILQDKLK